MPTVSISKLMYQSVPDSDPIENRLFEATSSKSNSTFFLSAKDQMIPLPTMGVDTKSVDLDPYLKLATKIDNTLKSFYRVGGKVNTHIRIDGMDSDYEEGMLELCYINTTHYNTAGKYGRKKFQDKIWVESESYSEMGRIRYFQDGSVKVYTENEIVEIAYSLLGKDEAFAAKSDKEFNSLTSRIEKGIDNLFIQQGFEPSEQNRQNLVSLVFGVSKSLLKTEEIQKLLGTNFRNHTIDNPNLIHRAAHGCNENMMKLFYTNNLYPDSIEAMVELAVMPFDMLYSIWAGKVQN